MTSSGVLIFHLRWASQKLWADVTTANEVRLQHKTSCVEKNAFLRQNAKEYVIVCCPQKTNQNELRVFQKM